MKKILLAVFTLFLAFLVAGVVIVGIELRMIEGELPEWRGLNDYRPPVVTKVYDKNGDVMAKYYRERRTVLQYAEIPERLRNAFVAAEDAAFFSNNGIDVSGVAMAAWSELKRRVVPGKRRGGSTITQQVVKTFLLTPERTYRRKIKEMVLAYRIKQAMTPAEILYLYLNQIYFGNGAYGVEEAALTYFGKHAKQLTLAECATLASIPKSPNDINPIRNPKRTLERREYVLRQMEKYGFATGTEVTAALAEPLPVARPTDEFMNKAPYAVDEVRKYLIAKYGEEEIYEKGLMVKTSIDSRASIAAAKALSEGLAEVDKRMGWRGPLIRLSDKARRSFLNEAHREVEERLPEGGLRETHVWDLTLVKPRTIEDDSVNAASQIRFVKREAGAVVVVPVIQIRDEEGFARVDLGTTIARLSMKDMVWARASLDGGGVGEIPTHPSKVLAVGDIVAVRIMKGAANTTEVALEQFTKVQGAIVSIQTDTRRIQTLVGGADFGRSNFNRATLAMRQPGSAWKPFIYAAGIASREFTPTTRMYDVPHSYVDEATGKEWSPENSDGKYKGEISLRECLTYSVNTCSLDLVEVLKPGKIIELAKKVGLGEAWPRNLTLALGTGEVTPLKLCNAYATFADEGMYAEPNLILEVSWSDGTILERAKLTKEQVLEPSVAFVTLSMMKSVVEHGTARRIKELARPVAGKTGTTSDARDAWFVGCVPGLCTAVYVGLDDHGKMGRNEYGGKAAAPIWLNFMKEAVRGTPIRDFLEPDGIAHANIAPTTGQLAVPGDEGVINEVFLSGTEPQAALEEKVGETPVVAVPVPEKFGPDTEDVGEADEP
ncbi:MAG: PBP1A family penicillin-binding protein [bacterium]